MTNNSNTIFVNLLGYSTLQTSPRCLCLCGCKQDREYQMQGTCESCFHNSHWSDNNPCNYDRQKEKYPDL